MIYTLCCFMLLIDSHNMGKKGAIPTSHEPIDNGNFTVWIYLWLYPTNHG